MLEQTIGLKGKMLDLWVSCRAIEGKIVSVSVQFRFSSNKGRAYISICQYFAQQGQLKGNPVKKELSSNESVKNATQRAVNDLNSPNGS